MLSEELREPKGEWTEERPEHEYPYPRHRYRQWQRHFT